jgi:hypothetical protein
VATVPDDLPADPGLTKCRLAPEFPELARALDFILL